MNSKKVIWSVLLVLALAFVGCGTCFAADPAYQYRYVTFRAGQASGQYTVITLSSGSQKKYPRLEEQVQDVNRRNKEEVEKEVRELGAQGFPLSYSVKITPTRLTRTLFSAKEEKLYSGGAHPTLLYSAINLDPETGNVLKPKDVLQNRDALVDAVLERLFAEAPELESLKTEALFDGSTLKERLSKQFDDGTLAFTLDKANLHIYLDENTLDIHARGTYDLTFPREGSPYVQTPYAI